MNFTTLNYGSWEFWEAYDPANNYFGAQKVTFDGYNKLIYVNEGETELDAKIDIYSAWKEWSSVLKTGFFDPDKGLTYPPDAQNLQWPLAITAVGGESISATEFLGTSFFLENGWRIKPWTSAAGYVLTITGNLFTREAGENPVIPESNVTVNLFRSSIVLATQTDVQLTDADKTAIADGVWTKSTAGSVAGSYGRLVNNIDSDLTTVKTEVDTTLKKGEYLAFQK